MISFTPDTNDPRVRKYLQAQRRNKMRPRIELMREEYIRIERARNAWRELAEARGKLLESYRLNKAPSESTWKKIEHAQNELTAVGEGAADDR